MADFWNTISNMQGSSWDDPKRMGWLNAAAQLLSAGSGGQPGTGRVPLGQALGNAMGGYYQGYSQGNQLKNAELKAQLDKLNMAKTLKEMSLLQQRQAFMAQVPAMLGYGVPKQEPLPTVPDATVTPGLPAPLDPQGNPLPVPPGAAAVSPPQAPVGNPAPAPMANIARTSPQQPAGAVLNANQTRMLDVATMAALNQMPELSNNLISLYNAQKPNLSWVEMPNGGKRLFNMTTGLPYDPAQAQPGFMAPGVKPEQYLNEQRDWSKNYYLPLQEVMNRFGAVKNLTALNEGGITDYGILIGALKALEPNSAVLQGEAESAGKMRSVAGQMSDILGKVRDGGLGSEAAREQLATLAQVATKIAVEAYNKQSERQRGIYQAGAFTQPMIDAILAPVAMPAGAESREALRKEIGFTGNGADQIPDWARKIAPVGATIIEQGGVYYYAVPGAADWTPMAMPPAQ